MMNQGQKGNVRTVDYTEYEEDIYVGYRYFDSFEVPVAYPFGYGLSYTTFEYADAKVADKGESYEVTVTVKNTGDLKPGESETVKMEVKAADLASFDEAASAWVVAEGEYQFLVAASAADIKATLPAAVKASSVKANDVLKPQAPLNLLKR